MVNRSNIAETRWLGYHAILAPFGIFATTWLLSVPERGQWEWDVWNSIPALAVLVDLGAVVYTMTAVTIDLGGRLVFWAWEQWKKDQRRRDELVRAELRAEEKQRLARFLKDGGTVEQWLQEPVSENGPTVPNSR